MAYTIAEKHASRKPVAGDKPANAFSFIVRGDDPADDENGAIAAVMALTTASITSVDGKTLNRSTVEVADTLANGWWVVEARYASADDDKQTGESEFSFDTSGGTFKITQSKLTRGRYLNPGGNSTSAPDLKGVIGDKGDGEPDGVEITIPQYAFSETHYIDAATVTDTYKGMLFSLTGRTNNAAFKGCAIGEALFLGASGSKRGRGDWSLTFKFAAQPNTTSLVVGGITGIVKQGWDYLWVRYLKAVVSTGANARLGNTPDSVYIEKVYDAGDFSLLGIGT